MSHSFGKPVVGVRAQWIGPVLAGFIDEADDDLKMWTARLGTFCEQTAHYTGDLRFTALKHDAQLKAKLGLARYRLAALKSASGENQVDATRSVESLWRDIRQSIVRRDVLAASLVGPTKGAGAGAEGGSPGR
jgi:hypothetical protein